MKHYEYIPKMVCSRLISFDLDEENRIHNLGFLGGCNGNLKAISKLLENRPAMDAVNILKGNTCGPRPTSCADQLTLALIEALKDAK